MAIEETRKKLHLVAFDIKKGREVDDSPAPTITITNGSMRFSKRLITELDLNGKFVRFFIDRVQNVIAFQYKNKVELGANNELKGVGKWKLVNQNGKTGLWSVSLKKVMLHQLGARSIKRKYTKLPVQKYREMTDVINRGEVYYFVKLVDEVDEKNPIPKENPFFEEPKEKSVHQISRELARSTA